MLKIEATCKLASEIGFLYGVVTCEWIRVVLIRVVVRS